MKSFLRIFATGAVVVALMAGMAVRAGARPASPASAPASPAAVEVKINNFIFSPSTLTVTAGTEVTWTNIDDIPHNVVSGDKTVKSRLLEKDEKFTFTFAKPGTYSYVCTLHPGMKGTVVVQ
jgi:amicyanin